MPSSLSSLAPSSATPPRWLGGCVRAPHRTPLRALSLALVFLASLALTPPAEACPDCAVGREARSLVWTEDFARNLLLAVVPFLLIGAVSALANRIGEAEASAPTAPPRGRK
jgi:hypothetical protein